MSCGVGHRCGLDLVLLWLWCRPVAAALIQPLAWELHMPWVWALKKTKKKNCRTPPECLPLSLSFTLPVPLYCFSQRLKIVTEVKVRVNL